MEYIIVTVLLFLLMWAYFKIADKYNIIDKPNHRSAHSEVTIRGGGIVFPVAFLLFFATKVWVTFARLPAGKAIFGSYDFWIFGLGLLLICAISFVDDILDLSTRIRIIFHIISVTLLLFFIDAFKILPIWAIPLVYILIIGILNAYNFMDGINGITGLYSLALLATLFYVNSNIVSFIAPAFIIYPALACLVFLFFNFRKKARCFMGDIGSMGIAFWITALLALLIMKTGDYKWILFLAVYGVEVIATIMERLKLKENIFKAHRRHLYQLFANEKKVSHLVVSGLYAGVQVLTNIFVIQSEFSTAVLSAMVLVPLGVFYFYLKFSVKKQIASL